MYKYIIILLFLINLQTFAFLPYKQNNKTIKINNSNELIENLEKNNLMNIKEEKINNFFIANFPRDLQKIEAKLKKRVFFHSILPSILKVNDKIKKEKIFILGIKNKKKYKNLNLKYFTSYIGMQAKDIVKILYLAKKYHSFNLNTLVTRVNTIPPSLILSQAAIESAWGGSRFSLEGNNIFGIWTKSNGKEKGLIPKRRKKNLKHMVKIYDSIQDGIEDYFYKLNTVKAYRLFRKLRMKTDNSIILAKGLIHYSQRKKEYVKDVQKLILKNRLQKYDKLELKNENK